LPHLTKSRCSRVITAGIGQDLTGVSSPGNISISAMEKLQLSQGSMVANVASLGSNGKAGNINVDANSVELTGGIIRTRTLGKGDAGDINIQAGNIYIDNPDYKSPGNDATLDDKPAIDAGNYKNNPVYGTGRSGNVSLFSNASITLIGRGTDQENKVISTYSRRGGKGGGSISLIAKDAIFFNNAYIVTSSFSNNAANVFLQGNQSISLTNNSAINAISFEIGNSGNITLSSQGSILLQTSKINTQVGNDSGSYRPKLGNAGDITISGRSVTIKDGTEVKSSSYTGRNSGHIKIIAPEFVEISGLGPFPTLVDYYRPRNFIYSSVTSSHEKNAVGTGGNIYISTNTLRLAQGAHIRANTRSPGSGGNITVDANVFEATAGGQIIATTSSKGDAGNITLNIKDQVNISGTNPNYNQNFQQVVAKILADADLEKKPKTEAEARSEAAIKIGSINSASGVYANTSDGSTGQGGDLNINTSNLTVRDNAKLSVASEGLGSAGNANINARTFILDRASLTADTRNINSDPNSEEATINIRSRDLLLLRGAKVTTNASGSKVIGGNININTDILAALQNSDISANSADSRGGKVFINAQGVIGTRFRDSLTDKSDITAKGASPELSGTVEINRPDTDPSQGLVELPFNVVDIANRIDHSCQPGIANTSRKNKFTITGRGGLSPSPFEALQPDNLQVNWITLPPDTPDMPMPTNTKTVNSSRDRSIVEASGWQINSKGEVFLVAKASTPNTPWLQPLTCKN
jgi:large exoprotein involved in heme utilization and adhesion